MCLPTALYRRWSPKPFGLESQPWSAASRERAVPSAGCHRGGGRDLPEGGTGRAGGHRDRGIRSREENGVWLMHPQQKNGQGLSFVSLFVTLQCGFDYSTWTQQISSLRTVENIDVLFTKNFWEAWCTYVSTTTCLDGFYLIAFWKAYGENFYCGAFNFEMCCAWRNKLLGVTALLYLCEVCWCKDVYYGLSFYCNLWGRWLDCTLLQISVCTQARLGRSSVC